MVRQRALGFLAHRLQRRVAARVKRHRALPQRACHLVPLRPLLADDRHGSRAAVSDPARSTRRIRSGDSLVAGRRLPAGQYDAAARARASGGSPPPPVRRRSANWNASMQTTASAQPDGQAGAPRGFPTANVGVLSKTEQRAPLGGLPIASAEKSMPTSRRRAHARSTSRARRGRRRGRRAGRRAAARAPSAISRRPSSGTRFDGPTSAGTPRCSVNSCCRAGERAMSANHWSK